MTPPQVALRQIPSQEGLIRLLPSSGDVEARPGETPEDAAYRGAIDAATAILAAYDGGTAKHSDDVLTVSEAIADRLNVTGDDKKHLLAVAELHDIGKIAVSSEILNKPGPLSDEEWDLMRRHTIEGEQILATVPEISEVAELVRACHERYDGQGYPDGLAGEDIPLVARIVFCADAFHAMRCDRPYREGRPVLDALAEMRANAGSQFDPVVVAALCDVHRTLATQRKHGLGILRSGARSRRLVALLATLAVGGSAMAATGAYKNLPLVHDGDARGVPAVIQERVSSLSNPIFGTAGSPAAKRDRGAGSNGAGSNGSSGAATGSPGSPPHGEATPDPRGVAHGVHGTAPGQSVRKTPRKVTPPESGAPQVKEPKPASEPKLAKEPKAAKEPVVKTPKVKAPSPTANPDSGHPAGPNVKKVKAPKL